MPPLVRAGLAAALLATLAVMTDRPPRSIRVGADVRPAGSAALLSALCPRGTLPDGEVCVPVPPEKPARGPEPSPGRARAEHDRIERRPDRPADFAKYRLPVDATTVRLVRLEHQEGEAEVLHAGDLESASGRVVVTLHAVRDTGGLREYLVIFSNLTRIEPAVTRGKTLRDGETIGTLAEFRAPNEAPRDFEIRRLRAGATARSLVPEDFVADARTVGCDPRNVLPLR